MKELWISLEKIYVHGGLSRGMLFYGRVTSTTRGYRRYIQFIGEPTNIPGGGWQPPTLSGCHDDSGAGQAKMLRVAWVPQFSGQWEFRDPKFEVATIYKAYERAM